MAHRSGNTEASVRVPINDGVIVGKHQPASEAYPKPLDIFYGIPYATHDRFQPAKPCSPVEKGRVLDAQTEGKYVPCPMASFVTEEGILRLNIFRPYHRASCSSTPQSPDEPTAKEAKEASLPVVIYIHGGAYMFSYPLERDLASLVAWAPRDILVVAVGYRLGALGFKSGDGGEGTETELNLGLRDQREAVEWVVRWIEDFGGSGRDITLMGVSAGAHSIGHHLIHPSPLPFTKAILESGSPTARSVLTPQHDRSRAQHSALQAMATRLARSRLGEQSPSLKTLPLDIVLQASMAVFAQHTESSTWPFQPVVDGTGGMIPHIPLRQIKSLCQTPKAKTLSVITGFCSHEGTQFVPLNLSTNAQFRNWFAALIPSFSQNDLDLLEKLYPDPETCPASPYRNLPSSHADGESHGAQFRRLHEAYAHYAYICPVLHTAHVLSQAGATVYLYEFAALSGPFNAASHGDQAPVVVHDMDTLRNCPGLVSVADEMVSRWGDFIASPDGKIGSWPQFKSPFGQTGSGSGRGELLVFGRGNNEAADGEKGGVAVQTRVLTDEEVAQCTFWWERLELSQGTGMRGQVAMEVL